MAGDWTELRGTREIQDQLTHKDCIFTAVADTASTRPSLGDAYTDIVPDSQSTLAPDSTGLAYDYELVQASDKYRMTPTKSGSTFRLRAPKSES